MMLYPKTYKQYLPTEGELARQRQEPPSFAPLISVVVPAYETPETYLRELIQSVLAQSYANFELCIADGSQSDGVERVVGEYVKRDGRVRYKRLRENGGISKNTNCGFAMAKGEYIALMDHDDLLTENALYEMAQCLNSEYSEEGRRMAMVYSDEDKVSRDGKTHSRPHFKPGFSLELLRRNNYFCHFLMFSKELLQKAGGLLSRFDGAQDFDFALRCVDCGAVVRHVPKILYHWRIHEGSTALNSGDKAYAFDKGCMAIKEHLSRRGVLGKVSVTADLGVYDVEYELHGEYEVTVEYTSEYEWKIIKKIYDRKSYEGKGYSLKLHYRKSQNSLLMGAKEGEEYEGEYVLFLRQNLLKCPEDLIERLLATCQQKGVGIVAPKYLHDAGHLFPTLYKQKVVSCGMAYDRQGNLVSLCQGISGAYKGYFLHAVVPQDVSAAFLCCAMIKMEAFRAAGMSACDVPGMFQDADYCFRIRRLGYSVIADPRVMVSVYPMEAYFDLEAASERSMDVGIGIKGKGRYELDKKAFYEIWKEGLKRPDPYYSPSLSMKYWRAYWPNPDVYGKQTRDIFIIGSKGIPARYGGFETFVEQLTRHRQNEDIHYHVACMGEEDREFEYQGAHCFQIKTPHIGPAKAVWYDVAAFRYSVRYIRENRPPRPIIYVLACRIGPFLRRLKKMAWMYDFSVFVNPDGHEWMRSKWNRAIQAYWKHSESKMVQYADLVVCDSKHMENYIHKEYRCEDPASTFIAYGADVEKSALSDSDEAFLAWLKKWGLQPMEYFLVVGRFVPENNYETILKEFKKAKTKKKLAVISDVKENPFYQRLEEATQFHEDDRIVFCQTVYEEQLLKKIRENACAYLHGHEVGGTNPSLLEALASTEVNLLLDVGFNREVAEHAAFYWTKEPGSLSELIAFASGLDEKDRAVYGKKAKQRIREAYAVKKIVSEYEELFMGWSQWMW